MELEELYSWLTKELQEIQRDRTRIENRFTQVLLKLRALQEGKSVDVWDLLASKEKSKDLYGEQYMWKVYE